ncbi:MAG: aconitate hydratase, partial [Bryobacteraceae bacterium]|nr:aconitate hydratase [Bryobacteraceae bacterium]
MPSNNSFSTRATLNSGGKSYTIYSLPALAKAGGYNLSRLPFSIKILLENLLRQEDERNVRRADIDYVAQWNPTAEKQEIAFMPARVLMQDFTGVPCVVDVATMRDALKD